MQRSIEQVSVPIAAFVALVVISIGLKVALGSQVDDPWLEHSVLVEHQLTRILDLQGFSTRRQLSPWQSTNILATRGDCRLSVRAASRGEVERTVYARDAANIGRLRYLLAGRSYQSPPTLAIFALKLKAKLFHWLVTSGSVPVPIALATSQECGANDFGLGDIRVPA